MLEIKFYKKQYDVKKFVMYRGEDNALAWPDWYCNVASNIDSAITTLSSIWVSEAIAFSYFSCTYNLDLMEIAARYKDGKWSTMLSS